LQHLQNYKIKLKKIKGSNLKVLIRYKNYTNNNFILEWANNNRYQARETATALFHKIDK